MVSLDMRTILFSSVLTDLVSTIVLIELWIRNSGRFKGTPFWAAAYVMQTLSLLLIILRGEIPYWISVDLSNTLMISSVLFCLIGLERFVDKRGPHIHNYFIIIFFAAIHTWFTFVDPDLRIRTLNLMVSMTAFSMQCIWLVYHRASSVMRETTRGVGVVFIVLSVINIIRIFDCFVSEYPSDDFLTARNFDVLVLISYQILLILLTYNIALMYNKRLLAGLATEEEKFSKAFHSSPYGILFTKFSDGQILEVNRGFLLMTGYQYQEVLEKTTFEINLWCDRDDRAKAVRELQKKGKINEVEYIFCSKSGDEIVGLLSAELITLKNERYILASINDITNRKRAEKSLHESEARLRELNATKDKFFSIIAHDLKNPFNAISGFSDLLVEKIKNKDYRDIEVYVETIRNSSQRAMNLLTNLLEWSRSQTGRMEFNPEYMDIVALINDVAELSNDYAQQKTVQIVKKLPENVSVYADKAMISTILRNLISNAVKFTHKGGRILISVEQNQYELIVSVTDNGIGISKDSVRKLFRIDESFSTTGTQNEAGTGLGLLLCNEFITKHNGRIWVESEPEKGSKFSFSIPVNTI